LVCLLTIRIVINLRSLSKERLGVISIENGFFFTVGNGFHSRLKM